MSQCASACQASGVPCVLLSHWPKQITRPSSESRGEGDARGPSFGRHAPLDHYSNKPQSFLCHKRLTSLPHARCPHSSSGPQASSVVALCSEYRVSCCESGQVYIGSSGAVSHMAPLDSRTSELKKRNAFLPKHEGDTGPGQPQQLRSEGRGKGATWQLCHFEIRGLRWPGPSALEMMGAPALGCSSLVGGHPFSFALWALGSAFGDTFPCQ